jgi:Mg/Co/Ni transporter MgtE
MNQQGPGCIVMAEKRQLLLKKIEQLLEAGDKGRLRTLLNDEHNSDIAEIVEIVASR